MIANTATIKSDSLQIASQIDFCIINYFCVKSFYIWNARNFVLTMLLAFVALQLVNFGFCCTLTMLLLCFGSGEETVGDLDLAMGESVSTSIFF